MLDTYLDFDASPSLIGPGDGISAAVEGERSASEGTCLMFSFLLDPVISSMYRGRSGEGEDDYSEYMSEENDELKTNNEKLKIEKHYFNYLNNFEDVKENEPKEITAIPSNFSSN